MLASFDSWQHEDERKITLIQLRYTYNRVEARGIDTESFY